MSTEGTKGDTYRELFGRTYEEHRKGWMACKRRIGQIVEARNKVNKARRKS